MDAEGDPEAEKADPEKVQKEAEKVFKESGVAGLAAYAKKKLGEWKTAEVKIAVVGQSGSGKSSFINTIRNIDDGDDGYAETDVAECTMEPKDYAFPNNPNIKLWDLPGAGTERFNAADYATKMKFRSYDAFVILSSERFTEIDLMIANKIKELKKPFFFARTKMDNAMRDEKRKKNFDAKKTAAKIRADSMKHLPGTSSEKIFLIANVPHDVLEKEFSDIKGQFQFENGLLQEQIVETLPEIQKTALVFSLTGNTTTLIDMKVKELSKRMKWAAAASAAAGVIPVPVVGAVVSAAADSAILTLEAAFQKMQLGIDEESINKMAKSIDMGKEGFLDHVNTNKFNPFELTMFKIVSSSAAAQVTKLTAALATSLAIDTAVEAGLSFIPIVGSLIGGAISGGFIYSQLKIMLYAHAKIATACNSVIEDMAAKMK